MELCKEYWRVKQNRIPRIKWEVLRKCHAHNQKKKLYLKFEIACYKGDNLLNKRTEILGTSRQGNKYKLKTCDLKDCRWTSGIVR